MKLPKLIVLTTVTAGLIITGGIVVPRLNSSASNMQYANYCGLDVVTGVQTECPPKVDPTPPPDDVQAPEQTSGGIPPAETPVAPSGTPNCH